MTEGLSQRNTQIRRSSSLSEKISRPRKPHVVVLGELAARLEGAISLKLLRWLRLKLKVEEVATAQTCPQLSVKGIVAEDTSCGQSSVACNL